MPTPKMHWTAYLWPGLPHLWMRGSCAGLAVAVGFTALANTMLLASFVYRQWITGDALWIGYWALAVTWLLALWQSLAVRRESIAEASADESSEVAASEEKRSQLDQMFREAQQRYLESDWVAAEQLLLKLLKHDARDVESRLMLATLWRHQGRHDEALRQLDRLERLEAADKWRHEIAAEREQIKQITFAQPERAETKAIETPNEDRNRRLAA